MPWVIIVYDVGQERVQGMRKICEPFLVRVQNSVFEGDITFSNLRRLKENMLNFIEVEHDNIRIYIFKEYSKGKIIELGQQIKRGNK
ncbi:MAG: CRISPR-associated endonuclease Cas2 [Thermoplasmata archaeon]